MTEKLHHLLGDMYALFIKSQNYHWNVESSSFVEIHTFLDAIYRGLVDPIDLLAERIRQLGDYVPIDLEYLKKNSDIPAPKAKLSDKEMIADLIKSFEVVIKCANAVLKETGEDSVTANMLTDRLTEFEKTVWMLKSYKF